MAAAIRHLIRNFHRHIVAFQNLQRNYAVVDQARAAIAMFFVIFREIATWRDPLWRCVTSHVRGLCFMLPGARGRATFGIRRKEVMDAQ